MCDALKIQVADPIHVCYNAQEDNMRWKQLLEGSGFRFLFHFRCQPQVGWRLSD